jgi:hypothetical protein
MDFKQNLFSEGFTEVNVVTEIYTTERWALDWRTYDSTNPQRNQGLVYSANYVVNIQNRYPRPGIAPEFQLRHNSQSGLVRESAIQNAHPYTVLATYRSVQRRNLPWRERLTLIYKPYFLL